MGNIAIRGLTQNNLKNISFNIPKGKIVVFTGVSGSGKSSIVFDTIAAESKRQMNETYPAFVRIRMPKYEKPQVEVIDNLTPSVIVDQTRLGGNARSTVGTISELYSSLRLLYSRIGQPYIGAASFFSFNDPNGMCPECSGMGKVSDIDVESVLDKEKSLNEGAILDSAFKVGSWSWRQYTESGLFDVDKPLKKYSAEEYSLLLYGGAQANSKIEGLYNQYIRLYLKRDLSHMSSHHKHKSESLLMQKECPSCRGKRLNHAARTCLINGYSIADLCEMELAALRSVLQQIDDPRVRTVLDSICAGLTRMIDIGLSYLQLGRETSSLSGEKRRGLSSCGSWAAV
jgi:excinuclease UvrABC ATPase subunit